MLICSKLPCRQICACTNSHSKVWVCKHSSLSTETVGRTRSPTQHVQHGFMAGFTCSILVAHANTAGKYIQNSSLGPCPFLVVFVQTNGSLPCSKAPPGAGEGAADSGGKVPRTPPQKGGKKQIGEMGVQGTVEALWYKTIMIKINETIVTHWKCQVWVLWSCSRPDSGSPKAGLLTTKYTSNSGAV